MINANIKQIQISCTHTFHKPFDCDSRLFFTHSYNNYYELNKCESECQWIRRYGKNSLEIFQHPVNWSKWTCKMNTLLCWTLNFCYRRRLDGSGNGGAYWCICVDQNKLAKVVIITSDIRFQKLIMSDDDHCESIEQDENWEPFNQLLSPNQLTYDISQLLFISHPN